MISEILFAARLNISARSGASMSLAISRYNFVVASCWPMLSCSSLPISLRSRSCPSMVACVSNRCWFSCSSIRRCTSFLRSVMSLKDEMMCRILPSSSSTGFAFTSSHTCSPAPCHGNTNNHIFHRLFGSSSAPHGPVCPFKRPFIFMYGLFKKFIYVGDFQYLAPVHETGRRLLYYTSGSGLRHLQALRPAAGL